MRTRGAIACRRDFICSSRTQDTRPSTARCALQRRGSGPGFVPSLTGLCEPKPIFGSSSEAASRHEGADLSRDRNDGNLSVKRGRFLFFSLGARLPARKLARQKTRAHAVIEIRRRCAKLETNGEGGSWLKARVVSAHLQYCLSSASRSLAAIRSCLLLRRLRPPRPLMRRQTLPPVNSSALGGLPRIIGPRIATAPRRKPKGNAANPM
jgi:hypothetical protein